MGGIDLPYGIKVKDLSEKTGLQQKKICNDLKKFEPSWFFDLYSEDIPPAYVAKDALRDPRIKEIEGELYKYGRLTKRWGPSSLGIYVEIRDGSSRLDTDCNTCEIQRLMEKHKKLANSIAREKYKKPLLSLSYWSGKRYVQKFFFDRNLAEAPVEEKEDITRVRDITSEDLGSTRVLPLDGLEPPPAT